MKKEKDNNKSNFTILMNTLNSSEITKFGKYLKAFYHTRQITKTIYPVYEKYYKSKKQILEVEMAFQKIHKKPSNPDTLKLFNNELSDLYKELKKFLIQEKILATNFEQEYLWLQILKEKELSHEKQLHFDQILKKETERKNGGISQPLHLFHLHDFAIADRDFLKTYEGAENLLLALRCLETFRLDTNLKYAIELKNREKILKIESTDVYFQNLVASYPQNKDISNINTELHYKLYLFLNNEEIDTYEDLKSFFWKHKEDFHADEQVSIITYLINYISRQIKAGKSALNKDALELYKFGLEKGLLFENGMMRAKPFQSIVNIACFLKEFDWVEKFIEEYQGFLEKDNRESSVKVALANVYFEGKKFQDVVNLLEGTELKEPILQVLIKSYFLASAYELSADIDLEEKCNSLRIYANRHKEIGPTNHITVSEFASILRALVMKKRTKEELQEKIKKTKHLFFRKWLEEKIDLYQPI